MTIAAPVDGNVTSVYAHEGQRVSTGHVLGAMNDWQWRADLASTEAKYQQAMLVMQNDLAHGAAQSGADRDRPNFCMRRWSVPAQESTMRNCVRRLTGSW